MYNSVNTCPKVLLQIYDNIVFKCKSLDVSNLHLITCLKYIPLKVGREMSLLIKYKLNYIGKIFIVVINFMEIIAFM